MVDPVVDVAGLAKAYGGRTIVQGVALRLLPGEVIGLVGANGGGKTTVLRMIAGLLRADAGTGTVLGFALARIDRARDRIGYMSQQLALYPDLTVRENLAFRARLFGRDVVAATLDAHGLQPVADQRVNRLSGGWARRALFAAAVLPAPELLLLDEPTAGLDAASRAALWSRIDAAAAGGAAVVVSTHDLHEAERLPQRLNFADGRAAPPR